MKKKHSLFDDLRNMHCTRILMGHSFFFVNFWSLLIVWPLNLIIRLIIWKNFWITLVIISHTIIIIRFSADYFESLFSKDFKIFQWIFSWNENTPKEFLNNIKNFWTITKLFVDKTEIQNQKCLSTIWRNFNLFEF